MVLVEVLISKWGIQIIYLYIKSLLSKMMRLGQVSINLMAFGKIVASKRIKSFTMLLFLRLFIVFKLFRLRFAKCLAGFNGVKSVVIASATGVDKSFAFCCCNVKGVLDLCTFARSSLLWHQANRRCRFIYNICTIFFFVIITTKAKWLIIIATVTS